jgi:integrase
MKGWVITRAAKDGSKRYDAAWRVGHKIKTKTFTKRKTADNYLTTMVKHVQDGTFVEVKPTTFREYAETWLKGLGNLKPNTRRGYGDHLRLHLIPAFGDLPLGHIGAGEVNAYLASQDGKLRPKTLTNHLSLLSRIMGDAVEAHHVMVNRLHRSRAIRRPKAIRESDEIVIEVLTPEEVNSVLDALPAMWYPFFLTGVCTGLRLGELLALTWGDFDEGAGRLWVRRAYSRGHFYLPKTKQSRRSVDIGDQLLAVLRGVRRERFGDTAPPPTALIFPSRTGGPLIPENLRQRVWTPALAAAGVRHVRIHSLRHFYASVLITNGENIKYISSQLGHASVQITVDRYGHLFPDARRAAAGRLEERLASSKNPADQAGTAENIPNSMEPEKGEVPRKALE